jgi:hypothetical protein
MTELTRQDWTRAEVEATVADYFEMLQCELKGFDFNKSEHRRGLTAVLNGRSDGAIERKHQNISAVLLELGFVYISGYKPLRNYQQLLFEVVSDRLRVDHTLVDLVRAQVTEPACIPSLDNFLAAKVDPPTSDPEDSRYRLNRPQISSAAIKGVDYLAIEARNRSLGAAGEGFVVRYEIARLTYAGKDRLASQVEHVSETQGDGMGFDVLSFEETGEERLIEVKTTAYGSSTPFFVSRKEVAISHEVSDQYFLYRTFDFRRRPRFFLKQGPLDSSFRLEPSQFLAMIRDE